MLRIVLAGCLLLAGCGGEIHLDRAGKVWIEKPPDNWEYAFGGISVEIKEKNGRWQATLSSRFRKVTPVEVTGAATWIGMAVGRGPCRAALARRHAAEYGLAVSAGNP